MTGVQTCALPILESCPSDGERRRHFAVACLPSAVNAAHSGTEGTGIVADCRIHHVLLLTYRQPFFSPLCPQGRKHIFCGRKRSVWLGCESLSFRVAYMPGQKRIEIIIMLDFCLGLRERRDQSRTVHRGAGLDINVEIIIFCSGSS